MEELENLWEFVQPQAGKLAGQTLQHVGLTTVSVLMAVICGTPLGVWIVGRTRIAAWVLGLAGVMQTIPSIALLGFLIPVLGIGALPAITALFLYALLPVIRNTYTGIVEVDPSVVESARGMGMSAGQILTRVQVPLAFPVILAGIRTATVICVGVATLAAYIGAGGLGEFIFGGIALNNPYMILAGAIPAALLAILLDYLLSLLRRVRVKRMKQFLLILPAAFLIFSAFYFVTATPGGLRAGFTPEFIGRQDGYPGLRSRYGLRIPNVVISDAVMYQAAYEKKLDVISGYSTDGRLQAFDLVTLEDDEGVFPPYFAAPLVRTEVLEKYPELGPVLDRLSGLIPDSVMTSLNFRADFMNLSPERIAREFLISKGLYRPPRSGTKGTIRLGSKIFTEQYILISMYSMLIRGYTELGTVSTTGLGGTRICFEALRNDQIDLYPEYTGTGLFVLLQPEPAEAATLTADPDRLYQYVRKQFGSRYRLSWLKPVGFNNTYALMMRRQQAEQLRIRTISDLKRYLDQH
ncbi:MAG TPA: ABC transporter permease/substrate-binding protein [Sphingobacteriaceae bacterium]